MLYNLNILNITTLKVDLIRLILQKQFIELVLWKKLY